MPREQHPLEGKKVRLLELGDDPSPVEAGTTGTVGLVDDAGTVHVDWDNGRSIGLIPGVDRWEVIA